MTIGTERGRHSRPVEGLRRKKVVSNEQHSVPRILAQVILCSLVVGTPWMLGTVEARIQTVVFAALGLVLVLCWLDQARDRTTTVKLPLAIVPLLLAILFAAFQIVPLPTPVHRLIAPQSAQLWSKLTDAGDPSLAASEVELGRDTSPTVEQTAPEDISPVLSSSPPAGIAEHPISLYPNSTRREISLLILAAGMFVAGVITFRSPRSILVLWAVVAANGAALALYGIGQQLSSQQSYYSRIAAESGGSSYSSFINKNNAAGYLLLCMAAAVGISVLALLTAARRRRSGRSSAAGRQRQRRRRSPNFFRWLARQVFEFFATLSTARLAGFALTCCIAAGVICSLSRGAWVAAVAAMMVTILVAATTRRAGLRVWFLAVAMIGALGLVGWAGRSQSVNQRLESLLNYEQTTSDVRLDHWRDGLRAATDFAAVGSGFGSYRYVYRFYEDRFNPIWFYHAENQYLEALVEGGTLGLLLLLSIIGMVGAACWRLLRRRTDAVLYALGLAGMFALTSQSIHALFDFGLYIPSNMLLFALLSGVVTGRAAETPPPSDSRISSSHPRRLRPTLAAWLPLRRRALTTSLVAMLAGGTAIGCLESFHRAEVEAAVAQVKLRDRPDAVPRDNLGRAIQALETALRDGGGDASAHQHLANLRIQLFRLDRFQRLRAQAADSVSDNELWNQTPTSLLHARLHAAARAGRVDELAELRGSENVARNLVQAHRHLGLARQSCPLLPRVHLRLGELRGIVTSPAADAWDFERAILLAQADPRLLMSCGQLELQAGRIDRACAAWRRCIELEPEYIERVLPVADAQLDLVQYAQSILPADPNLVVEVARKKFSDQHNAAIRRALADRSSELIARATLAEDTTLYLKGVVRELKQDPAGAIKLYQQAINLRPNEAAWRFDLARLLNEQGKLDDAHTQAKQCVRLVPNNERYKGLLKEIIRTRLTRGDATRT